MQTGDAKGRTTARDARKPLLWSLLLAVLGLVATLSVTGWLLDVERQAQESALARQGDQTITVISTRFAQYETLLNAASALLASSERVNRLEWRRFSETVLAQQDFAGLAGLGWVARIAPERLTDLQARIRADGLEPHGLDPSGQDWLCPIVFNEPVDQNELSIGLNVCRVERLTASLDRARESGHITMSRHLDLVSDDGSREAGYVMLDWVPQANGDFGNQGGWVSAAIAARSLFDTPIPSGSVDRLIITDLSDPSTPTVFERAGAPASEASMIEQEVLFEAAGKQWALRLAKDPRTGSGPGFALIVGLIGTLLVTTVLYLLLSTRIRAEVLAKQMSKAYRDTATMLTSITSNIFEGIYRGTPEKGLIYANRALAKMFSFDSPKDMIRDAGPLLYADQAQRQALIERLDRDGYYNDVEVEFVRNDGSRFTALNNAVAVKNRHGKIRYFDGVIYDITARKQAESEIHRLAHYDALTGLPNRALFNDRLRSSLAQARRAEEQLAVLFLDLDHFKTINDSLGHDTGDRLLTQIGNRLREQLREGDMVCRQGGDEFLIMLRRAEERSAAQAASRILELMSQPVHIDRHDLRVSPSIGIALYPSDGQSAPELIRNADAAMYLAKDKGRSNFQFFTPDLNRRAHEQLLLERDLRQALADGDLRLHYQPQVHLETGEVVGFEALLRWTHPERGVVSPDTFIPIAEQCGLIVDIGDWVIDEACRQLAAWRDGPLSQRPLCINVSALQLWRGTLYDVLSGAIQRHDIPAQLLTIELTESALMRDARQAAEMIENVCRLGIQVAIDDFGTGYSSLAYLKRFNISLLKIDRSFIADLATDPDDAAIVAAVISMADDLQLDVIAEGVDSAEQVEWLRAHGCHLVQGFLFSPAVAADDLMAWVRQRPAKESPAPSS